MKRFLIILPILLHINAKAQLAPAGTLWNYFSTHIREGIPESYVTLYTITKDTLLQGKVYSEIIESRSNKTFYRTIDSGKVYFWVNEQHNLLFDMNVEVHDTLTVSENNGYDNQVTQVLHTIDSIYFIKDKKGDSLKVYETTSGKTFADKAMSLTEYLTHNSLPYREITGEYSVDLQCYVEPGEFSFLRIDSSSCDYISTQEVAEIQNLVSIYPNPAKHKLFILNNTQYPVHHIELYDLRGKKIFETNQQSISSIYIDLFPPGNYWLVVELINQIRIIKKISIASR